MNTAIMSPKEVAEHAFGHEFANRFKAGDDPEVVAEKAALAMFANRWIEKDGSPGARAHKIAAGFGPHPDDEFGPLKGV